MAASDLASETRIGLSIAPALMKRLTRYATERGTTPEAILLESVQAFLDQASAREPEPEPAPASVPGVPMIAPDVPDAIT